MIANLVIAILVTAERIIVVGMSVKHPLSKPQNEHHKWDLVLNEYLTNRVYVV